MYQFVHVVNVVMTVICVIIFKINVSNIILHSTRSCKTLKRIGLVSAWKTNVIWQLRTQRLVNHLALKKLMTQA